MSEYKLDQDTHLEVLEVFEPLNLMIMNIIDAFMSTTT